ncbi:MAG: hypothetical protein HQ559_15340, partial [Lentisphaerae bacterium]|nr:hypothetical protein [Lentisphaerota bacterium]
ELVGQRVGRFKIRHVDTVSLFARGKHVDLGVIAVPSASAQEVADLLIFGGVRGLLNLSSTRILAPRRVRVGSARIVLDLLVLAAEVFSESD